MSIAAAAVGASLISVSMLSHSPDEIMIQPSPMTGGQLLRAHPGQDPERPRAACLQMHSLQQRGAPGNSRHSTGISRVASRSS